MSLRETANWKGIACILIVFHHMSQMVSELPVVLIPIRYIGFCLVSLFMFFSGYGLMYSLNNKEDYLGKSFKGRLLKLLIPHFMVEVLWGIYSIIKNEFTWYKTIKHLICGNWYVTVIFIFYILFFCIFNAFDTKKAKAIMWFLTVVMFTFLLVLCDSQWYASLFAFPFGISTYENRFIKKCADMFKNQFLLKICLSITFLGLFFGRLYLQYLNYDDVLFHGVARNIVSIIFVFLVMVLNRCVKVPDMGLFSKIYYEVYLLHFIVLRVVFDNLVFGYFEKTILVCVITLLLSIVLYNIDRKIFRIFSI